MLIVQNNEGLANANTYVSESELQDYAALRGISLVSEPSVLLTKAMDYLSLKQFKGEPMNSLQSTALPRKGIGVPQAIKQAQLMLAVAADNRELVAPTASDKVKRERVDVVEVEYFEAESSGLIEFPAIDSLLAPYLDGASSGFSGFNIRVFRG